MSSIKNKIAVVTGGNSGIGFATAGELKQQGAVVAITGRWDDALREAAGKLGLDDFYKSDQGNLDDIEPLVQAITTKYKKVDILVINAGVGSFQPIAVTSEKAFDQMMSVNFKGVFFTIQKFLPFLNEGASIVLISSNGASMASPGTSVYSASKAALNTLMKIAAIEFAPRRIRVNAISPGPTETEMMHKFGFDEATLKGMKESIVNNVPLGRIGQAKDVAKLAAYLSDPETSSFITGAEFFIDGGMVIR